MANPDCEPRKAIDYCLVSVPGADRVGYAIFFILISWVPLALYIVFGLPDLIKAWKTQQWAKTPCIIISNTPILYSAGGEESPKTGQFYGADLKYSYGFGPAKYTGDRYSISSPFAKLRSPSPDTVRTTYQLGEELTCYVNPKDPSQAVLDRSFTSLQYAAMFLIPPLFIVFGILAPMSVMRQVRARKAAASRG